MRILHCPVCGIEYGLPDAFIDSRREGRQKEGWYCPNGHRLHITETELDKMRRERDQARQQIARADDLLRAAERERKKTEDALKRQTRRVVHGVCPCCNRSFANMARHMKTKHPDVVPILQGKLA